MQIETAIRTALAADATITTLIAGRIYYVRAVQDVLKPYIVITKVSAQRMYVNAGTRGNVSSVFQIDTFGTTHTGVVAVNNAVQAVLSGYQGTLGGAGGVVVQGAFYNDENAFYEDDTQLFHIAADYRIFYEE